MIDRTLMGHSWGGVFALYALFRKPDLFQRYVVVSPDIPAGDEWQYAQHHDSLPVQLFLAFGETELQNDEQSRIGFMSLIRDLESWKYASFTLNYQIIASCTHCAVVAPAFQAGLVAVMV